jgi:hypothetical protein
VVTEGLVAHLLQLVALVVQAAAVVDILALALAGLVIRQAQLHLKETLAVLVIIPLVLAQKAAAAAVLLLLEEAIQVLMVVLELHLLYLVLL